MRKYRRKVRVLLSLSLEESAECNVSLSASDSFIISPPSSPDLLLHVDMPKLVHNDIATTLKESSHLLLKARSWLASHHLPPEKPPPPRHPTADTLATARRAATRTCPSKPQPQPNKAGQLRGRVNHQTKRRLVRPTNPPTSVQTKRAPMVAFVPSESSSSVSKPPSINKSCLSSDIATTEDAEKYCSKNAVENIIDVRKSRLCKQNLQTVEIPRALITQKGPSIGISPNPNIRIEQRTSNVRLVSVTVTSPPRVDSSDENSSTHDVVTHICAAVQTEEVLTLTRPVSAQTEHVIENFQTASPPSTQARKTTFQAAVQTDTVAVNDETSLTKRAISLVAVSVQTEVPIVRSAPAAVQTEKVTLCGAQVQTEKTEYHHETTQTSPQAKNNEMGPSGDWDIPAPLPKLPSAFENIPMSSLVSPASMNLRLPHIEYATVSLSQNISQPLPTVDSIVSSVQDNFGCLEDSTTNAVCKPSTILNTIQDSTLSKVHVNISPHSQIVSPPQTNVEQISKPSRHIDSPLPDIYVIPSSADEMASRPHEIVASVVELPTSKSPPNIAPSYSQKISSSVLPLLTLTGRGIFRSRQVYQNPLSGPPSSSSGSTSDTLTPSSSSSSTSTKSECTETRATSSSDGATSDSVSEIASSYKGSCSEDVTQRSQGEVSLKSQGEISVKSSDGINTQSQREISLKSEGEICIPAFQRNKILQLARNLAPHLLKKKDQSLSEGEASVGQLLTFNQK